MLREAVRPGRSQSLAIDCALWKTPHGMGGMDASGKHGGAGGGEFAKQANNWPTPMNGMGENSHGQISGQFRRQMDEGIRLMEAADD